MRKQLDNMTGQEIKEMIEKDNISLEQLDDSSLEKIMSYEIDMLCFNSGDMMTIRRCAMIINERDNDNTLTKDSVISIIDKTEKEHITIVNEKEQLPKAKIIKKHITLRRIGLVAAVITVILATTALLASAFNVNIFEYISEIVRKDQGSRIDVDGFTFYHNGESKQYSSIEEMIEKENLDIMYPTKWPEGIYVVTTQLVTEINGNTVVQFFTNNVAINFEVELNSSPKTSNSDQSYEHNGVLYHIVKHDIYTAACNYKGKNYYISADTKEKLILIIENIKEFNK